MGQHVRHRADVILVAVREHERADPVFVELPEVRDHEIDAEQLRLWEEHAGIDQDGGIAAGDHHHVHAEFPEPSQRDDLERRHVPR